MNSLMKQAFVSGDLFFGSMSGNHQWGRERERDYSLYVDELQVAITLLGFGEVGGGSSNSARGDTSGGANTRKKMKASNTLVKADSMY